MRRSAVMLKSLCAQITAVVVLIGSDPISAQSTKADLIVKNGKVHTLNAKQPTADTFAVKDGKFMAVGSETEIMKLKSNGKDTQVIDAGGRTVIPGLNDSHLH